MSAWETRRVRRCDMNRNFTSAAPMSQNDPKRTSFALTAETEAKRPDDPY
jgi:hypothetical protein